MPTSAILDPTNRLLGWSTNDLSLYGGQPSVTIGTPDTGSAASDGLSVPYSGSASAPAPTAAPAAADFTAIPVAEAPAFDAVSSSSALPAISFLPTGSPTFSSIATGSVFDPQVPSPTGSGSVAPAAVSSLLAQHVPSSEDAAGEGVGSALAAPSLGSSFAAPVLQIALPAIAELPALASEALAGGLTAPVLGLADMVQDTAGGVNTALAAPLDSVHVVAETVPTVLDSLIGDSVLTAVDSFAGSDPQAGVATLVSMVDSADAFDLAHAGGAVPALGHTGSIIDALADDAVPDALLGDAAHHAIDSLIPDHHDDGVLGLL